MEGDARTGTGGDGGTGAGKSHALPTAEGRRGGREKEEGRVGPFPGWGWVYAALLTYGTLTILLLWALTRILDPGASL